MAKKIPRWDSREEIKVNEPLRAFDASSTAYTDQFGSNAKSEPISSVRLLKMYRKLAADIIQVAGYDAEAIMRPAKTTVAAARKLLTDAPQVVLDAVMLAVAVDAAIEEIESSADHAATTSLHETGFMMGMFYQRILNYKNYKVIGAGASKLASDPLRGKRESRWAVAEPWIKAELEARKDPDDIACRGAKRFGGPVATMKKYVNKVMLGRSDSV